MSERHLCALNAEWRWCLDVLKQNCLSNCLNTDWDLLISGLRRDQKLICMARTQKTHKIRPCAKITCTCFVTNYYSRHVVTRTWFTPGHNITERNWPKKEIKTSFHRCPFLRRISVASLWWMLLKYKDGEIMDGWIWVVSDTLDLWISILSAHTIKCMKTSWQSREDTQRQTNKRWSDELSYHFTGKVIWEAPRAVVRSLALPITPLLLIPSLSPAPGAPFIYSFICPFCLMSCWFVVIRRQRDGAIYTKSSSDHP